MNLMVLGHYAQRHYAQTEITPKRKLRPRKLGYSKRIAAIFSGYYLKVLACLLYGSVASLPSPSSNIEAWPYWHVAPLRFAPAFEALGVCEHS